jgi:hypothetical protein
MNGRNIRNRICKESYKNRSKKRSDVKKKRRENRSMKSNALRQNCYATGRRWLTVKLRSVKKPLTRSKELNRQIRHL